MVKKQTQLLLRENRRAFKNRLKIYCKLNHISQRSISDHLGITEQEFHNMLTGYQSSIPTKGIDSFEEFKVNVEEFVGE